MVEQVLGAHQDQRLGEGPVHLAAQHVEQLRTIRPPVMRYLNTVYPIDISRGSRCAPAVAAKLVVVAH